MFSAYTATHASTCSLLLHPALRPAPPHLPRYSLQPRPPLLWPRGSRLHYALHQVFRHRHVSTALVIIISRDVVIISRLALLALPPAAPDRHGSLECVPKARPWRRRGRAAGADSEAADTNALPSMLGGDAFVTSSASHAAPFTCVSSPPSLPRSCCPPHKSPVIATPAICHARHAHPHPLKASSPPTRGGISLLAVLPSPHEIPLSHKNSAPYAVTATLLCTRRQHHHRRSSKHRAVELCRQPQVGNLVVAKDSAIFTANGPHVAVCCRCNGIAKVSRRSKRLRTSSSHTRRYRFVVIITVPQGIDCATGPQLAPPQCACHCTPPSPPPAPQTLPSLAVSVLTFSSCHHGPERCDLFRPRYTPPQTKQMTGIS